MRCKVKLFSTNPTELAADGSHVPASSFLEYRNSDNYKKMIASKTGWVSATHRGRALSNATNSGSTIAKSVGRNDMSLLMTEHGAEPIFYITSLDLENDGWVYAWIESFPPENMDDNALQTYKRLQYLIMAGCLISTSMVCLAFWSEEPGSKKSIAKKIVSISGLDFTTGPSWADSGIVESYDDSGNLISSLSEQLSTKKFSDIQLDDIKFEEVKVKMFSDVSDIPGAAGLPKSSKIDGSFTRLGAKSFSYTGTCGGICEITEDEEDKTFSEPEQKEFTQAQVRERLREAKMGGPRMEMRRTILSYKQLLKQMGGIDKMNPEDVKILKSLLTSDLLRIVGSVSDQIASGKNINTLLGLSSLGSTFRKYGQALMMPMKLGINELKRNGFVTKARYQKLQAAYTDFVNAVVEDIFGPNPSPIINEDENLEENEE